MAAVYERARAEKMQMVTRWAACAWFLKHFTVMDYKRTHGCAHGRNIVERADASSV